MVPGGQLFLQSNLLLAAVIFNSYFCQILSYYTSRALQEPIFKSS